MMATVSSRFWTKGFGDGAVDSLRSPRRPNGRNPLPSAAFMIPKEKACEDPKVIKGHGPVLSISSQGLLFQGSGREQKNGLDRRTEAAGELPQHQRGNGAAPDPTQHSRLMGKARLYPGDPDRQRVLVRSPPSG